MVMTFLVTRRRISYSLSTGLRGPGAVSSTVMHVPVILQGHNYPGHPWIAVAMMVVVTSLLNVVLVWCRRRSRVDLGPCAGAPGEINALAGLGGSSTTTSIHASAHRWG